MSYQKGTARVRRALSGTRRTGGTVLILLRGEAQAESGGGEGKVEVACLPGGEVLKINLPRRPHCGCQRVECQSQRLVDGGMRHIPTESQQKRDATVEIPQASGWCV